MKAVNLSIGELQGKCEAKPVDPYIDAERVFLVCCSPAGSYSRMPGDRHVKRLGRPSATKGDRCCKVPANLSHFPSPRAWSSWCQDHDRRDRRQLEGGCPERHRADCRYALHHVGTGSLAPLPGERQGVMSGDMQKLIERYVQTWMGRRESV
jgi:hypothetical protein